MSFKDCTGFVENPERRKTVCTSELYKTYNLPPRFENPFWFRSFGMDREPQPHPLYRTNNMDYGFLAPTPHTVCAKFFPMNRAFTKRQSLGGMWRNYSLNTGLDTQPY